jgi:hypothetical protein
MLPSAAPQLQQQQMATGNFQQKQAQQDTGSTIPLSIQEMLASSQQYQYQQYQHQQHQHQHEEGHNNGASSTVDPSTADWLTQLQSNLPDGNLKMPPW